MIVGYGVGTSVEVRGRFEPSWNQGFRIAEETPDGIRLERESDHYVLPFWFPREDIRPLP